MNERRKQQVEVELEYVTGQDDPARGIFRNHAVAPDLGSRLMIAVRALGEATDFPENPHQLQVHLVGTADGLEELGKYLIALARLETEDPEPYASFDDVKNADGGLIRFLPRRVQQLPS